jgi:hypothetical protein
MVNSLNPQLAEEMYCCLRKSDYFKLTLLQFNVHYTTEEKHKSAIDFLKAWAVGLEELDKQDLHQ